MAKLNVTLNSTYNWKDGEIWLFFIPSSMLTRLRFLLQLEIRIWSRFAENHVNLSVRLLTFESERNPKFSHFFQQSLAVSFYVDNCTIKHFIFLPFSVPYTFLVFHDQSCIQADQAYNCSSNLKYWHISLFSKEGWNIKLAHLNSNDEA